MVVCAPSSPSLRHVALGRLSVLNDPATNSGDRVVPSVTRVVHLSLRQSRDQPDPAPHPFLPASALLVGRHAALRSHTPSQFQASCVARRGPACHQPWRGFAQPSRATYRSCSSLALRRSKWAIGACDFNRSNRSVMAGHYLAMPAPGRVPCNENITRAGPKSAARSLTTAPHGRSCHHGYDDPRGVCSPSPRPSGRRL